MAGLPAPATDSAPQTGAAASYNDAGGEAGNGTLEAALAYAGLGWAVFPTRGHGADGKAPLTKNGFKNATTDPDGVREFFADHPERGIGVSNGLPSGGLVVIDIDRPHGEGEPDGMELFKEFLKETGTDLPATPCEITARDGYHLYFKTAEERFFVRRASGNPMGPKLEWLGGDGYTSVPPVLGAMEGRRWLQGRSPFEIEVAELPEWLYDALDAFGARKKAELAADAPQDGGAKQKARKKAARNAEGGEDKEPFRLPARIEQGARNGILFGYACQLRAKGNTDDEVLALVSLANNNRCVVPLPDDEVTQIVDGVIERYPCGRCKMTVADVVELMRSDRQLVGICMDIITGRPYIRGRAPWGRGDRSWNDSDTSNLFAYMQQVYKVSRRKDVADAFAIVVAGREFNPIAETLGSLPPWDGTKRAGLIPSMFLGAAVAEATAETWWCWMCGAVKRAYEPGCKFDWMPVLVGPQGCGKSSLLALLAMDEAWFTDSIGNPGDPKKGGESVRGVWLVEVSELGAFKGRSRDDVKAFVSRRYDNYRQSYGTYSEQWPRTCVFCGTTNSRNIIDDPTGGRRFYPIECGVQEPTMSVFDGGALDEIKQAWAEVLAAYHGDARAGEFRTVVPRSAEAEMNERREAYKAADPIAEGVAAYLGKLPQNRRAVCVKEVALEGLAIDEGEFATRGMVARDIADALDNAPGWKRYDRNRQRMDFPKYGKQTAWVRVA